MAELLLETKKLDAQIDEVLPLLITDQWKKANEKLPEVFAAIQQYFNTLVASSEELAGRNIQMDFDAFVDILKRLLWCMQAGDSIQMADILAYEMGQILQSMYTGLE